MQVALPIVPNASELDASLRVHLEWRGARGWVGSGDITKTGRQGEDAIDQMARLKDLIPGEVQSTFIRLTSDGDIIITSRAIRDMFGAETLKTVLGVPPLLATLGPRE